MVYKREYNSMNIVELISVCLGEGINYHKGGEILNAEAIRVLLGKKVR
ncbi:hypothetical protein LCGC14_2200530 [marine sediment metagenome]|uniref:Uncharacterized protein n=1 Tax=marine sediment metagenome TaxID=412755 RepID=A0A0F9DGU2_9ZZZZ